jgi:hypothetical protein
MPVWTLRMATLMAVGTLLVHQLRFALSGGAQPVNGHAYLVPLAPVLAGLLLIGCASALARLARGVADPAPRLRRLWAGASASLFGVYCVQEAIEGSLTSGHPGGFAHGGWIALPLAIAIGLAIALLMRGVASIARRAPRRWRVPVAVAPVETSLRLPAFPRAVSVERHLAPRGPPLASVHSS